MPLYKRLCLKDLEKLADIMSSGERNLANAAMELGVDPSGLRKTILKYRVLEPQRPSLNQCGKRMHCKLTDACRPCPYRTAHEMVGDMASVNDNSAEAEKETEPVATMPLKDRIIGVLRQNPKGMRSGKIASLLGASKKEVNRILYANRNSFEQDFLSWRLKGGSK